MNWMCVMTDPVYDESTRLIVERAPTLGDCKVLCYDSQWFLAHPFWKLPGNWWMKDHPLKRGLFFYCWKPLVILDAMERFASDGDVIMYNDADSLPVKPFAHLFDRCKRECDGIMLFRASGHKNYQWTKRDAYICMGLDEPGFHNRALDAGVARFCLFEKGPWRPKQFLMEWFCYSINRYVTTFDKSRYGEEDEGFIEGRMEQAVLSLLAYKHCITLDPELDYEPPNLFDQQNPRPVESRQVTAPILGSKWRNV